MKKNMKIVACVLVLCSMMSACNAKKDVEDAKDKVENKANTAKKDVDDSIDHFMNYFKEKGVKYESDETIDQMDFAAYEGRSFMFNGSRAYLYRVKSNDENMKKVLQEAKDKGKVKVNVDNKESEYAARVNGDYLLLYDTKADMREVLNAFPGYTPGTTTTTTSTQEDTDDQSNSNTDTNTEKED